MRNLQIALAIGFILFIGIGAVVLGVWYWNSSRPTNVFVPATPTRRPNNPNTFRGPNRPPVRAPLPQAKDPGPTLVSLDLAAVSPRRAVEALSEKSAIPIAAHHESVWQQVA